MVSIVYVVSVLTNNCHYWSPLDIVPVCSYEYFCAHSTICVQPYICLKRHVSNNYLFHYDVFSITHSSVIALFFFCSIPFLFALGIVLAAFAQCIHLSVRNSNACETTQWDYFCNNSGSMYLDAYHFMISLRK